MSNLFFKYLDHRFHSKSKYSKQNEERFENYGPLITISRQAGCSARDIADLFYKAINKNALPKSSQWKCVDKDIILDSAKALDLPPRKIKYVFNSQKKSTMDEIVESLSSRYYKSDNLIRKTIIKVMKEFAEMGHTIIVGRAGVALSQHINCSLNIRLVAPIEWRIKQISQKHGVTEEVAKEYIDKIDYRRKALIEEFYGKELEESMFDLILNCESNSKEEIVRICYDMMKVKDLI